MIQIPDTTIRSLVEGINDAELKGKIDEIISHISYSSREIVRNENTRGVIFIAYKGPSLDGHDFIDTALDNGATCIIAEHITKAQEKRAICTVLVSDSVIAKAQIACNAFGNPSHEISLIGVTGTNGKTTVTTLLTQALEHLGAKTGLIGTVDIRYADTILPNSQTTPDTLYINMHLRNMISYGCTHCCIEVSSHSIDQRRIEGLVFTGGVFTNITRDHLDYHRTFDHYLLTKKRFFDNLLPSSFALSNSDDESGIIMLDHTKAGRYTYGLLDQDGNQSGYDDDQTLLGQHFFGKIISNSFHGLTMNIDATTVESKLIGRFNAYNLLAVFSTLSLLGFDNEEIGFALEKCKPARGRFESYLIAGRVGIVDYAHTPDALLNVLKTLHEIRGENQRIITIVGAGGDRDQGKRPLMGAIAEKYSDLVIITSDNPRSENPLDIIHDIQQGFSGSESDSLLIIENRADAILQAVLRSQHGDIILCAGKGHENYQEIENVKYPFDDLEILRNSFQSLTH